MPENNIKIVEGKTDILLIAPHGVKSDDEQTDSLALKAAKELGCSALINDSIKRTQQDYNRIKEATKNEEFIKNIRAVLNADGNTLVVWLHGMSEESSRKESESLGLKGTLDCVVGYGQPDRCSAEENTVNKLVELMRDSCFAALPAADSSCFRGWDNNNMNQWFRQQAEYKDLKNIQSIQLEIRKKGFRDSQENIEKTARIISATLSAVVRPDSQDKEQPEKILKSYAETKIMTAVEMNGSQPSALPNENKPDEALVDESFKFLKDIFFRHFRKAMLEAGTYIIKEFFDNKIELARNPKNAVKIKSLHQLIKKMQEGNGTSPSKTWIYNSIKLVIDESDFRNFPTYGKIGHSHKMSLLSVPTKEKRTLVEETVSNNYTVRELNSRIAGMKSKNNFDDILTLIGMPERLFSLERSNGINQKDISGLKGYDLKKAYGKITRKISSLESEIDKLNKTLLVDKNYIEKYKNLLSAIDKIKKPKKGKKFKGWPKTNILCEDGITRKHTVPIIISASWITDLPAFYSDWFIERLRKGYLIKKNPRTHKKQYISFSKTRLIVFWSKNPQPLIKHLDEIASMGIGYYFLFTLNDYDKNLEPNMPPLAERIETFKKLSDRKEVGKDKIIWRFDPLILTDDLTKEILVEKIYNILSQLAGYTTKLVFSFFKGDIRPRVIKKMTKANICVHDFSKDDIDYIARNLGKMGTDFGIKVETCGEPSDFSQYGIGHGQCINYNLMKKKFSNDDALMEFIGDGTGLKDPNQRRECNCIVSQNIGEYNTCGHYCRYCYANGSEKVVKENIKRITHTGALLLPDK